MIDLLSSLVCYVEGDNVWSIPLENLYLGAGLTTPGPDRLVLPEKINNEWGCLGS